MTEIERGANKVRFQLYLQVSRNYCFAQRMDMQPTSMQPEEKSDADNYI